MICSTEECQYRDLTESVIKDLKVSVDKLAEGQGQMREAIAQLTEAFKQMDRLERRLDKIEEEGKKENKEQGESIKVLEKNFYRAAGSVGALLFVVQVALKVFFGV